MPSARTVVLYTLLWARPERLGAGFSCGGRKTALTAPGSLMALGGEYVFRIRIHSYYTCI